ncbi:hypothetical protein XENORESO_014398 [Xenotaenia resolanae]|uniref:Uncharacterized protein n=1 Tax=Xenotaenia resolanae TaxID=208358 RepID=A0ABV0X2U9_9TELE
MLHPASSQGLLHLTVGTGECGTFRHLEIGPKDKPDLMGSTILFLVSWLISFDFPMMSQKETGAFPVNLAALIKGLQSNGIITWTFLNCSSAELCAGCFGVTLS